MLMMRVRTTTGTIYNKFTVESKISSHLGFNPMTTW